MLCDVLMPGTDGYELCLALRAIRALAHGAGGARVGLLRRGADEELARSVGANALVTRTPELEQVMAALRSALSRGRRAAVSAAPELRPQRQHADRVMAQLKRQARANAGFAERSALQAAQLSILAGIAEALLRSDALESALDDVLAPASMRAASRAARCTSSAHDGELVLTQSRGLSDSAASALEHAFGCSAALAQAQPSQVVSSARACLLPKPSELLTRERRGRGRVHSLRAKSSAASVRCCSARLRGDVGAQTCSRSARAIGAQIAQALALAESFARLRDGEEAGSGAVGIARPRADAWRRWVAWPPRAWRTCAIGSKLGHGTDRRAYLHADARRDAAPALALTR